MASLTPIVVGLNHRTAPLEVREKVAFTQSDLGEALPLFHEQVGQGVILSTCNRTEIYTVSENPARTADRVQESVARLRGIAASDIEPYFRSLTDKKAVSHLFRVASGLD